MIWPKPDSVNMYMHIIGLKEIKDETKEFEKYDTSCNVIESKIPIEIWVFLLYKFKITCFNLVCSL